jgi:hypothetical protein
MLATSSRATRQKCCNPDQARVSAVAEAAAPIAEAFGVFFWSFPEQKKFSAQEN